jgi:O-antigen/teichoic acid export membrane protein
MIVGTLLAAVGAYLFQLLAGRVLGPEALAPITVLWTIQFLVFTTVFMPMEQLTIRRLNATVPRAAPWSLFLWLIAASTVGAVVFGELTLDRLFAGEPWYLVNLAVLIVAYGGFAIGRGFLAGRRRYREYGFSTLAESTLRLALAAALLAAGVGPLGVSWSLVAGALVIWLWWPLRGERTREAAYDRETGSGGTLATFIVANASAQTIVAAGPLVVGALGAREAEVSIFFETFLLFRAPLTVSYSLIARVLPPFTSIVEAGRLDVLRRWTLRIAAAGAACAAAGYWVGWVIGADAVELLLGAEFRPSPELAAMAAAGVTLATVALFEQQLLIAMRSTRAMAGAWLVALAVAAGVVAFDGAGASIRVGRAFLAGEVAALVALTATVLGKTRRVSGLRSRR